MKERTYTLTEKELAGVVGYAVINTLRSVRAAGLATGELNKVVNTSLAQCLITMSQEQPKHDLEKLDELAEACSNSVGYLADEFDAFAENRSDDEILNLMMNAISIYEDHSSSDLSKAKEILRVH